MSEDIKDRIIQDFATNLIRLGNECRDWAAECKDLKAEVERLESDLKLEKENEDRLVRLWQTANNEVHGQRSQIAALIDNQTRLKAENERLRKAGVAMGMCLPDTDEANKAYRDFETGGKQTE